MFTIEHPTRRQFFLDAMTEENMYDWLDSIRESQAKPDTSFKYAEFYQTLGIEETATPIQIKKAYRKLVSSYSVSASM